MGSWCVSSLSPTSLLWRGIVPNNSITDRLKVRVLGKHCSDQGGASGKNRLSGVKIRPFHQLKSHGVGGCIRSRPDGFSNGCKEFAHGPDGVGCNFTAIQGGGEDERSNNSLVVCILPAEIAESVGNGVPVAMRLLSVHPNSLAPVEMCALRSRKCRTTWTQVLLTGQTWAARLARVGPHVVNK